WVETGGLDRGVVGGLGALLRGRSATAAATPGLIADGPVRHLAEAELPQRLHLAALQAHQGDEDLVPVGVEHRARPALLRASPLRGAGPARRWREGGRHLVEHDPWNSQEPLTPGCRSQWI